MNQDSQESNMLILTRKVGETLVIGDDITVTICAVKHSQVRVGIKAPAHIEIHREEIYERIQKERAAQKMEQESKGDNTAANN